MENIMDFMSTALRGDALSQLSTQMHESPVATRRGLESAVPASVAALAAYGSSENKAEELLGAIKGGNYPHVDPDQVANVTSDPEATSRIAQSSSGFLARIFGNRLDGAIDALAGVSGLGRGSASTLLGLAAPLVMGLVGKEVSSRNLDAKGLGGWLAEQGRNALGMLPAPLATAMGGAAALGGASSFGRTGDSDVLHRARQEVRGEQVYRARSAELEHPTRSNRGLWWLLGAAAVALLGWLMFRTPRVQETTTEVDVERVVPADQGPAVQERSGPPATGEHVLPAESAAAAARTRAAEKQAAANVGAAKAATDAAGLSAVLDGSSALPATIQLTQVQFATASSTLPRTPMLDDVAASLTQRDTARIRLEGFADARGSAAVNEPLALARAQAVKEYLVAHGVPADHIETVGRSTDRPVATNQSAGGRAENRRVELTVLER
jgi:OmpA-OmpF porin, OOP family